MRSDKISESQRKTQHLHFTFHANYFLLSWKIPEEKQTIHALQLLKTVSSTSKIMSIQPFEEG